MKFKFKFLLSFSVNFCRKVHKLITVLENKPSVETVDIRHYFHDLRFDCFGTCWKGNMQNIKHQWRSEKRWNLPFQILARFKMLKIIRIVELKTPFNKTREESFEQTISGKWDEKLIGKVWAFFLLKIFQWEFIWAAESSHVSFVKNQSMLSVCFKCFVQRYKKMKLNS